MSIEILFENFELLIATAEGINKLRDLILMLAIQGRLGTQEEKDESAVHLLKKINSKKEVLIKEKKIKVKPHLNPIKPREILFPVPNNWVWSRIGNIGQVVSGGTPRTDHPEYYSDHGIPWITPSDLYQSHRKTISRGKKDISLLGLQKSSAQLIPKDAVLFSSRAPIGYVAIAENDLTTNQGFKTCIPFVPEMSEFIYYYLRFSAKRIAHQASGTTFKEISAKEFSSIIIPIPPLDEQSRIVKKLDYFVTLCNLLQEKRRQIDSYKGNLEDAIIYQVIRQP